MADFSKPDTKRISDQAVKEATGKNWEQWFEILDQAGAAKLNHTRIAGYLRSQHDVKPWWSQMVANIYEHGRGLREIGETEANFEVGVRKTLPLGPKAAWELLTNPGGLEVWLGNCDDFKLEKGFNYSTEEGVSGEVRVVSLGSHWRMSWKLASWGKPTTLQVRMLPAGENTTISFHQEGLLGTGERELMRQRWQKALKELEELT